MEKCFFVIFSPKIKIQNFQKIHFQPEKMSETSPIFQRMWSRRRRSSVPSSGDESSLGYGLRGF